MLVALVGDRLPVRVSLAAGAFVVGLSTIVMHSVTTPWEGFIAAFLFGTGLGYAATIIPVAWANYYGRKNYGAIRGITLSVQIAGQAAGPLIAGVLYRLFGLPAKNV